jgi:hypothetical protein
MCQSMTGMRESAISGYQIRTDFNESNARNNVWSDLGSEKPNYVICNHSPGLDGPTHGRASVACHAMLNPVFFAIVARKQRWRRDARRRFSAILHSSDRLRSQG